MLKLPKGLKKKKKGKKSKRKGEDELFTEEELDKYRKEHQKQLQQVEGEKGPVKENEEWSKFKDLTTGVDSVLKKTQGDLDRIKSTSFFQRIPAGPKEVDSVGKERLQRQVESPRKPIVEVTAADFPQLVSQAAADAEDEPSEYGLTDEESEEDDQDDIFDTSYVEAVERGEVKLAYVPDSPDQIDDDDIFDTSHVDVLIKGQEVRSSKGKKALDIGVAVEVLTGRIDNVTLPTTKRSKRVIPGDLLLENADKESTFVIAKSLTDPVEKSILDVDEDIPINTPIDLSVSLHTSLLQQQKKQESHDNLSELNHSIEENKHSEEDEFDEFTLLAAESLEASCEVTKLLNNEVKLEPVLKESWSVFEADKNELVFAEGIVEDQIDVIDPYIDQDDPFDTSFADAVIPISQFDQVNKQLDILEDDDDFDPRAEEVKYKFNNRRKSSVRIHLTDPSGVRESITSDDINVKEENEGVSRDLLGGSCTDLSQLGDSPLDPIEINSPEDFDPFDTTIVDKIVAPGRVELKLLEKELIGTSPQVSIYRVPSDPDFDPRAEESETVKIERRASRPENLVVSKTVVFNLEYGDIETVFDNKTKQPKPLTPYYTRELSITEDKSEEAEAADIVPEILKRTRSDEDIAPKITYQEKRRHSAYPQPSQVKLKASELFESKASELLTKVLTPSGPGSFEPAAEQEIDPFDTSFAGEIAPCKTELKLLAKEFSCEETNDNKPDLLEVSDDIFQIKALTPEPTANSAISEKDFDPFDTSFAGDLQPGKSELKLLESEFLS